MVTGCCRSLCIDNPKNNKALRALASTHICLTVCQFAHTYTDRKSNGSAYQRHSGYCQAGNTRDGVQTASIVLHSSSIRDHACSGLRTNKQVEAFPSALVSYQQLPQVHRTIVGCLTCSHRLVIGGVSFLFLSPKSSNLPVQKVHIIKELKSYKLTQ